MSHQDQMSAIVVNHQTIKQAIDWLLPPALFASMKARSNATWKPRMLALTALMWSTSGLTTLKDRFDRAREIVKKIFRWQPPPGVSYQGFMKMLNKWHNLLLLAIIPHIRCQMEEVLPGKWKIAGYVVFAADGSRIELARTQSLEDAFSPKRSKRKQKKRKKQPRRSRRAKGPTKRRVGTAQSAAAKKKKADSPQMWLTLSWHVGSGLPWAWTTGPSDSSERAHLLEMLPELPENSLITADAGYVGYEFCKTILDGGRNFLIRVGGNAKFIKKLGYAREYDQTVYLWPDREAKKKQPPLKLRLIVVHNGKQPMYLLTNLTKTQLSDRQAARIYAGRWGIELFFRTFKQTFGRRKLRSHAAENAKLECDWSLLALWCVCLLGQRELIKSGQDPGRLSAAAAIKAVQSTQAEYRVRPESLKETLWSKLRVALLDDYERKSSKTSRNYPRKKKRERIGPPTITKATKKQIDAAKAFKDKQLEQRLSA